MSGFNRQYLGNVRVRSGKLVVMDPRTTVPALEKKAQEAIQNEERGGAVGAQGVVAFEAPFSDGEYPVFANYDVHGNITSIEVRLEEEAGDIEGEKSALEESKS